MVITIFAWIKYIFRTVNLMIFNYNCIGLSIDIKM